MWVEVTAESVDDARRLDNFVVTVHLPEELDEAGRGAVEAATKMCKVGNTLEAGAKIETRMA